MKNKPSITAKKVAACVLTLDQLPEMADILPEGIVDATEQLLLASGVVTEKAIDFIRSPKMLKIYRFFDPLMPGQFEAFAHRKAFCERQVRNAIGEGASQALVLGAGYDTLTWRLAPQFPSVQFFEIDHPATAALKAKGLAEMGSRKNLHLIAENLADRDLKTVLDADKRWDPDGKTIFVAEGLVMYLSTESLTHLLRQCGAVSGVGSRIAFSYIPMAEDGLPTLGKMKRLMLWLQKVSGEPLLWSIAPQDLRGFLEKTGWVIRETSPMHGVEFFVTATRD